METIREGHHVDQEPRYRVGTMPSSGYRRDGRESSSEVMKDSIGEKAFEAPFRQPVPPFSPGGGGRYRPLPTKAPPGKHLQSVVTTSFSVEDTSLSPDRYHLTTDHREALESSQWRKDASEERSPPPHPPPAIVVTTSSPRGYAERQQSRPLPISRSYSTTTVDSYNSLPMKRNYFHHVQSNQQPYGSRGLPADFVPPKRSKSGSSPRKSDAVVLTARPEHDTETRQWYAPGPHHWEPHYREMAGYPEESHMRSQSFPTPRWADQKHPGSPGHHQHMYPRFSHRGQVMEISPRSQEESSREAWRRNNWYPHPPSQHPHHWDPRSQARQHRDDVETSHARAIHREMRESFDEDGSRDSSSIVYSDRNTIFRHTSAVPPPMYNHTGDKMKLVMEAASFTEGRHDLDSKIASSSSFRQKSGSEQGMLLAMPEDKVSLSETLCVVREVRNCIKNLLCIRGTFVSNRVPLFPSQ